MASSLVPVSCSPPYTGCLQRRPGCFTSVEASYRSAPGSRREALPSRRSHSGAVLTTRSDQSVFFLCVPSRAGICRPFAFALLCSTISHPMLFVLS
ncbi:hypothetical protein B0H12DRAFT_1125984 [Mycena haematopus]|nr:hypothetical protein B0H12DRAFT_1125984 [Mycena haematopus]